MVENLGEETEINLSFDHFVVFRERKVLSFK